MTFCVDSSLKPVYEYFYLYFCFLACYSEKNRSPEGHPLILPPAKSPAFSVSVPCHPSLYPGQVPQMASKTTHPLCSGPHPHSLTFTKTVPSYSQKLSHLSSLFYILTFSFTTRTFPLKYKYTIQLPPDT